MPNWESICARTGCIRIGIRATGGTRGVNRRLKLDSGAAAKVDKRASERKMAERWLAPNLGYEPERVVELA